MKKLLMAAVLAAQTSGAAAQGDDPMRYVKLETSKGDIVLELNAQLAPKTVANFLRYVQEGFYDGTIFHRVVSNFVIQGGGYTADLKKKATHEPIENEADSMLPNLKGTIAMARTNHPHSATSQFFINLDDNLALNHAGKSHSQSWGYAVFGTVVAGNDVVETIRMAEVGPQGPFRGDVPKEPIVIQAATLLEGPPAAEAAPAAETAPEGAAEVDSGIRSESN